MSGTSCDGIDVALVDFSQKIRLVASHFVAYPDDIKHQVLALINNQSITMQRLSRLDTKLGHLYADAVNKLLAEHTIDKAEVSAIGLHGQTVYHEPNHHFANTLQIGSATTTAKLTGIITIANFRQSDVAHGGQGAPLAPILHQNLFAQLGQHVVVLNLGGIANISSINGKKVIGFDTGPASCLMDEWMQIHRSKAFDENGQWARQGKVNQALLKALLTEPYFNRFYPKSTGRELFNLSWLKQFLNNHPDKPENIQRTLLQLTIESIALGIKQLQQTIDHVVVCGGGSHNTFLMELLAHKLQVSIKSSDHYGLNPDYIEAILMAWFAWQYIEQNILDLSGITGTNTAMLYGIQYRP